MKNFILTFITVLAGGLLGYWGVPWWSLVPVGLAAGWLIRNTPARGFAAGFLAGFLLWGIWAFALDHANEGILSARIGMLFQCLGNWMLILITALLGGLVAGFAVLSGSLGYDLAFPPKKGPYARRRRRR